MYALVSDSFSVTPSSEVSNYVFIGEERRISCRAASRNCKITDFKWMRYVSEEVIPSQHVQITTESLDDNTMETAILFTNIAEEHIGAYLCIASNECGESKYDSYIHLTGEICLLLNFYTVQCK